MRLSEKPGNPQDVEHAYSPNAPEKTKTGPKGPYKHGPLVEAMIANEAYRGTHKFASVAELADRFNVTHATVYTYRKRLAMKDLIQLQVRRPDDGSADFGPTIAELKRDPEALIRAISDEPILGPIDRLKILSRLVRTASPIIKISAIKAIEDLSRSTEGRVGPPPPLTEEDRVARLARLMLAIGETTVRAALAITFPTPQTETNETVQPESPPIQPSPLPSPAPLPDLPAEATTGG